jgi:hypothetical protein
MKIKSSSNLFPIFSFGVVLLFAWILQSCKKENSSDVNQDKIYAEYELAYDENLDKTPIATPIVSKIDYNMQYESDDENSQIIM